VALLPVAAVASSLPGRARPGSGEAARRVAPWVVTSRVSR
jgi:hypothetical protein